MAAALLKSARKFASYGAVLLIVWWADPQQTLVTVGLGMVVVGIAVRIWGCGHLEKNLLVVTTGPYAHVKNPLYLGTLCCMTGFLLAASSTEGTGRWILFGLLPIYVLGFYVYYLPRKYRVEKNRLRERFGEAFDRYDGAVNDFLPRARPWHSGDDRCFRWSLVWSNHEPPMDLLILAVFAAIARRGDLPF